MPVAVELDAPSMQDQACALLMELGAKNMVKMEGENIDGDWPDFDASSAPACLEECKPIRS